MTKRILILALACAGTLLAQAPQFQSQEEMDAFMAIQNAATADVRASASSDFIAKHPKSEAIGLASYMAMLSYSELNDFESMLLYGDMTLANDPTPGVKVGTLVSLANAIPNRTKEFDLDKEEKLSKAEDYAKEAMALIPTLPKLDPNLDEDAWLQTKMDFMSQCHEAVGLVLLARKDFPGAEGALRKALEVSPQPVAFTMFNLAKALFEQGKKEDGAAMADRCTAAGGMQIGGADLCAQLKSSL